MYKRQIKFYLHNEELRKDYFIKNIMNSNIIKSVELNKYHLSV